MHPTGALIRITPVKRTIASALLMSVACSSAHADPTPAADPTDTANASPGGLQEITVTAQRLELLGTAATASEGVVDDQELQLAPQYRPGQLLETVPGLIVTLHSGEGKANQYLMRGYNLDHGTDLETYVDGMPINQPTHAHGQGYTDLNFMIPELADQLTYTKGPYYAECRRFRRGGLGARELSGHDRGSGVRDRRNPRVSTHLQRRARRPWGRETCWPPWKCSTTTARS